ncbi:hypothetical protein C8R44DRAFT_856019 [Mycena epipterygia]|nr:hypothetical protein C8R44DRAFT_856019 [Mycena epipterygia]
MFLGGSIELRSESALIKIPQDPIQLTSHDRRNLRTRCATYTLAAYPYLAFVGGTTDGIIPETIVDACSESAGNLSHIINQTLALVSSGYTIILFIGTSALYVSFATRPGLTPMRLTYQLSGEVVGHFNASDSDLTSPDDIGTLGYQNTSMPNGLHSALPQSRLPQFLFDGAIYSYMFSSLVRTLAYLLPSSSSDDKAASVGASGSKPTSASSAELAPSTINIQTTARISSRKKCRAATIAGGVVAGVAAFVAALLIARGLLRRRVRRRNGAYQDNFLADEEKWTSRPGAGATNNDVVPTEQARVQQAQFQADDAPSESGCTSTSSTSVEAGTPAFSTMKSVQAQAVRDYAPAAWDLLVHTDSGLCLEPGRAHRGARMVRELPPVYVEERLPEWANFCGSLAVGRLWRWDVRLSTSAGINSPYLFFRIPGTTRVWTRRVDGVSSPVPAEETKSRDPGEQVPGHVIRHPSCRPRLERWRLTPALKISLDLYQDSVSSPKLTSRSVPLPRAPERWSGKKLALVIRSKVGRGGDHAGFISVFFGAATHILEQSREERPSDRHPDCASRLGTCAEGSPLNDDMKNSYGTLEGSDNGMGRSDYRDPHPRAIIAGKSLALVIRSKGGRGGTGLRSESNRAPLDSASRLGTTAETPIIRNFGRGPISSHNYRGEKFGAGDSIKGDGETS